AGAILAARMERIPVLLDGHAALGAALVLHATDPRSLAHCRLASRMRGGYGTVAQVIGFDPVLEFGAGLDGGAGAALAAAVVKSAAQIAIDLA
ncbi:MAG: nicotinate-nucleotide--dimethylbenzimidazole phosphoribosyltransferase, partial [Rhizobiaceae bacterium]